MIARERARLLLQVALEAEVADFLGRFPTERGGRQKGYRNGRRPRTVSCGCGSFEVAMPKVAEPFLTERSALALVWACLEEDRLKWRGVRMSPKLAAAIAQARESVQNEPISIPAAENYLAVT